MSGRGAQLVIEVSADRLTAVAAQVGGGRVEVTSVVRAARPDDVDHRDAERVGAWVRSSLDDGDVKARGVVIGVERHEVALKRLALPVMPKQASDLIGMVRLQMARQLAFPADDAAIDFVILEPGGQPLAGGGVSGPVVLAAAMPGERVRWLLTMARHAGLRVSRIGLKSAGAAALVARRIVERDGVVLGIVPAGEAIEFVAIERGQLVFSRRAEPTAGEASADAAARAALEAKRTWMSYRSSPDSGTVAGAVVLGDDESARQTAVRCAEALEMPCRAAGLPEEVSLPAHALEDAAAVMLAGLLLEDATGSAGVDLSRAARPSRSAVRRRQAAMLCVLGLIVGVGGLFSWGAMQKRAALAELEALREQRSALAGDRLRALRDLARLDHVRRWESIGPAWTSHLAAIVETMPEADRALIDVLRCREVLPKVTYQPRSRGDGYNPKSWSATVKVSMTMSGRASGLPVVEAMRESFVRSRTYDVMPMGEDGLSVKDERYPAAFTLNLMATQPPASSKDGSSEASGGQP